jgi:hypothetical protein
MSDLTATKFNGCMKPMIIRCESPNDRRHKARATGALLDHARRLYAPRMHVAMKLFLAAAVKRLAFRAHCFAGASVSLAFPHEAHLGSAVKRFAVRAYRPANAGLRRSGADCEAGNQRRQHKTPHRFLLHTQAQRQRSDTLRQGQRSATIIVSAGDHRCSTDDPILIDDRVKKWSCRSARSIGCASWASSKIPRKSFETRKPPLACSVPRS